MTFHPPSDNTLDARPRSLLRRALFALTALTLFLSPTQLGPFARIPTLTVADALLVVVSGVFALCVAQRAVKPRAPSPFAIAFLVFGAVSVAAAEQRGEAVKNVVQWFFYFGMAWMAFRAALDDASARRVMLRTAAVAALCTVLLALAQFVRTAGTEIVGGDVPWWLHPGEDVRALFGNRNVLAGFFALSLPFGAALALSSGVARWMRVAGGVAALAGVCCTLSGAAAIALAVAVLAMAAMRGRAALACAFGAVLLTVVVVHPHLPRRTELADPWMDSIALHTPSGEVSRRYPDWECAWLMATESPWTGVGAGNYQKAISPYRRIPTPPGAPEPDTQNLFLVLAASVGIPGALAFVAMLLDGMARAAKATGGADAGRGALALGAFGSLLAFCIAAIWHPLLVRGIGIPLAFVLAAADAVSMNPTPNPAEDNHEV